MPSWIIIGSAGYFLLAFTGIADKFLVSKVVREPVAYAFYTAITGPFSIALVLFGNKTLGHFQFLNFQDLVAALLAGVAFIVGVYFSWTAISRSSVSRVIPIQGGLGPIFTLIFAFMILGERLTFFQSIGFLFLVVGAVMISIRLEHGSWTVKALLYAALSAVFFALSSVLLKYTFDHSTYISGMVWTRIGFVLPVPFILLFKKNRKAIFNAPKEAGAKNVALYYASRATGTLGGFLQTYAVKIGSVSLVSALQGLQFVFLLIFAVFISIYYPNILKENITKDTIMLKIISIAMISSGLFLLFQ